VADALQLPLPDGRLDGALVAFGVRNFDDLDAGLRELHRVLAPGARLVVLEFTTPRFAIVRSAYHLYFHRVLPLVGRVVSGHPTAYRYLPQSVANFPAAPALARRLEDAGFTHVGYELLTFGIAAVHWGERSGASATERAA
jgi:demethylmenaquinone methyltransferase/2-methoxy-6-polyprenyl-1,4-benzoquinol methylase